MKQIDISEISNTTLDPGVYQIKPVTLEKAITPRRHNPGVVLDFSKVAFYMAATLRIETARDLAIWGGKWQNIEETGIVVSDDVFGLWMRGQVIDTCGTHAIKISGGTEEVHPKDLWLADILINKAGQSAESGDGVNLHTAKGNGHVTRVVFDRVRVMKTGGEKESFGISAEHARNITLVDCEGDGNCKFGHGVTDVAVWGGKYETLHFKYVGGLLVMGGPITAAAIEFAKQGGINANEVSRNVRIAAELANKSPFTKIKNGQGATIKFEAVEDLDRTIIAWPKWATPETAEETPGETPVDPPIPDPAPEEETDFPAEGNEAAKAYAETLLLQAQGIRTMSEGLIQLINDLKSSL